MAKITSIRLEAETLERVDRLAEAIDRPRSWVVNDAIQRYLDYEEWFVAKVEEGIAQADHGNLVDHDLVVARALGVARGEQKLRE